VVAAPAQPVQPYATEQVRQPDRDIRKPPEPPLTVGVRQEDRQAADHARSALGQLQRSGQRQAVGVAGEHGLTLLARIAELVETDQAFVARARKHMPHHAVGRQRQGLHAQAAVEQLAGCGLEMDDLSVALVHQRRQRMVARQHPFDVALHDLGPFAGELRRSFALPALLLGIEPHQQARAQRQQQHEHQRGDEPGRPCAAAQRDRYVDSRTGGRHQRSPISKVTAAGNVRNAAAVEVRMVRAMRPKVTSRTCSTGGLSPTPPGGYASV
jgi:hypothetical protein